MANEFSKTEFRARCLNVVDGDTVDLLIDIGFHITFTGRFRILGINTAELHAKDPAERVLAVAAKDQVTAWLKPSQATSVDWPLQVRTKKDTDSFGRWLAEITLDIDGLPSQSVGQKLLELKLAVPYKG